MAAGADQTQSGLSVAPATFDLSANPGEIIKNSIKVENLTNVPLEVSVDRRNFTALGEEGEAALTDDTTPYALATWITVDPMVQTIAPHEIKVYNYTITVPQLAEPGGHFGSIIFKTAPRPVAGGSGVAIAQEVGSLLLLKVAGDIVEKAEIESFQPTHGFFEYGPVGFDTRIKNSGNVHFKPTGTITIANMFGQKVATLNLDSKNVLPDSIRHLSNSWSQKLLFGRYTATLSVVYGSNSRILTATTTFGGFPYRVGLVILIVLLLIAVVMFRARRRIARSLRVLFGKEQ